LSTSAKIALLVACFFWAVSFIAVKVALESTPPTPALTLVTLRLIVAAFCFIAWYALAGKQIKWGGRGWWLTLLGLSLVGMGHYSVQTIGLKYTSASKASVFTVTGPISIMLLGRIFLAEKISLRKSIGILIALCGVLIVIWGDTVSVLSEPSILVGDLLVLTSIVMWGMFTVFGKKMTEQQGALQMTGLVTVIGSLWMIPICLGELHQQSFGLAQISGEAWRAILFLGVTCSFLAILLYFLAVERSEAQKVGVYLYTIPPMTAVIAYFYLGESLGVNFFVGSLLVMGGVFLTEKG
jgi:drug/metabolite transporter (DMT)-like permease